MAYNGTDNDDVIDQAVLKIAEWEQIYGKKGNDKITFGNAIAIGGEGNDTLTGTSIYSTVAYWDSYKGVNINLTTGIAQDGFGTTDQIINIHWVQGSGYDDIITGSTGNDFLVGGAGNNTFTGGGGSDQVIYYFEKSTAVNISYDAATDTFTVKKNFSNGDKGTDTLTGIDSISFSGTGSDNTLITKKNFVATGGFLRSMNTSKISYANNVNPSQFKIGDFNGDGHSDYALVTQIGYGEEPSPTVIYRGDGKGNFSDASAALLATSSLGVAGGGRTIVSDFNRDGMSDIFQVNFGVDAPPYPGGLNRLYLSSTATQKLTDVSATVSQVLAQHHAASAGDLNGDGVPDLLVNSLSNGNLLYINDGSGQLNARQDLLPSSLKNLTNTSSGMVDINNDGVLDLVLGRWEAQSSTPSSLILVNDGKGDFSRAQPINLPASVVPLEIILDAKEIDINGDGLADLMLSITHGGGSATSHDEAYYNTAYIQLLVNQGNGQFKDETALRLPADLANQQKKGWYMSLTAVDFNHDGHTDILATAANNDSTSIVLMNQGDGHFKETWSSEKYGLSIASDVNEDGMMDILTLTSVQASSTVHVETNTLTSGGIYKAQLDGHRLIGSSGSSAYNLPIAA
ncbi:MAG: VCBS repeat-containing protein [Burkholderiales bacterium]|nr:VCBS repeat-containing protein [Burkholderiales bacterium]